MSVHYWASAGYRGMVGFVISLLWVITGLVIIIVAGCMFVCCKDGLKPVPNFDNFGNYTTLGLLMLSTVAAVVGCGALFAGQEALHSELSAMLTNLMTQFAAVANANVANVPPMAAPQAAQTAAAIETAMNSTSTTIHAGLDDIRLWLLILSATMLVFALVGLVLYVICNLWWLVMNHTCVLGVVPGTVFVACHVRPIIYTLVAVGWLLVVGTWILCGVFLLVEAVIGDTCVAMKEWVANPVAGTSFDMIVQCKANNNNNSTPPPSAAAPAAATDTCAQMRNSFVPIFTAVVKNNCPSLNIDARRVWRSLFVLSTGSMVSICLWIVFTRRSTMRLTKVQASGNPLPFQFEEHKKESDTGASSTSQSIHRQ